ncbi:MAG: PAS domain S-box protein [Gammaproteobacteria bacterium]|nr:PAS domain S-box protein [Gammaproteobacteria bacterium]
MKPRKPTLSVAKQKSASPPAGPGFETNILRLVKGAHESSAIKSGQVDAILDPVSGRAILLPDAQAALLERKARFRSLIELASDGFWEQDEHYRFVLHNGVAIGNEPSKKESILGKTLWELPFSNSHEIDWPTYQRQLEWRAVFRDMEFQYLDSAGQLRIISLSGEPFFDLQAQFKGYRGITRDITAHKLAVTAAPESDRFARLTLDGLAAQVCVLDASGVIITANNAWRAFAASRDGMGIGTGVTEGGNYLTACGQTLGHDQVDAIAMVAGIRQVINGERQLFRYEYFTAGAARWFMATVTHLNEASVARAIVSYEDITDIKRTEQLLRLEYDVTRILVNANNTSVALKAVMRAIGETQQWDCGRYFRLDPAAEVFYLDESWSVPAPAVLQFLQKSRGAVSHPRAGLMGRVCESGQPLWVVNGTQDARASQIALTHETGLDGAFIFPVVAESQVIGVLAFASRIVREPDERLLQTVKHIGEQLGQFFHRQRAENILRQSEVRFRRLTELSSDWIWEQDRDFRFTKVAGDIRNTGHVLGQFLWDPSAQVVLAESAWIQLKSQLAERWSFCDFEYAVMHKDGRLGYYYISGEPVYDETGAFIGYCGTGLDITQRKRAEIVSRDIE